MTGGQFDVFTRGRIVGLFEAGKSGTEIASIVKKTNNKHPKVQAVNKTIQKYKSMKHWSGERVVGSGRQFSLSAAVKQRIIDIIFKHRGSNVVTIKFIKKRLPSTRQVSDQTMSNAIKAGGLAWLRRRMKRFIPKKYIKPRVSFSRWLLRLPEHEAMNFAFIDGTTYYLALCDTQAQDKQRGRLGKFVYRESSGKDGLFADNIDPSLYAAKQGLPVKVWGLLCNGHLCVHILPEDPSTKSGTAHMNGERFQDMISQYGQKWLRACWSGRLLHKVALVQDHEKCLWAEESLACLAVSHLEPLGNYPVCSPDLNVIECVWALLRQRLEMDAPAGIEKRKDFIVRLRTAVRWLNSKDDVLLKLCHGMRQRARDVLRQKGGRTSW